METKECRSFYHLPAQLSPAWFEYKIKPFIWTKGLDFGITLGYLCNRNRTCIETGIRQSRAESGWELSFWEYTPSPVGTGTYTKSHLVVQHGVKQIKIPILFSTQIAYWDSLKLNKAQAFSLHCNFIAGINIVRQEYLNVYKTEETRILSPITLMSVHYRKYAWDAPHYILPEIGFSLELRKRKQEWATVTFYYLLRPSRFGLSGQDIDIDITDTSTNKNIDYGYLLAGRGDGFLLEISKRIFFSKTKKELKFIKGDI
jgi:hypothetical protein